VNSSFGAFSSHSIGKRVVVDLAIGHVTPRVTRVRMVVLEVLNQSA
jgi:hypothetical protein